LRFDHIRRAALAQNHRGAGGTGDQFQDQDQDQTATVTGPTFGANQGMYNFNRGV
jgi:hypothetical protein